MSTKGSFFKRKDQKWCGRYKDGSGKWRYLYRKTKGEARTALREALKDRDEGIAPTDHSQMWEDMFYEVADEACRHRGKRMFEPLEYLAGATYPGHVESVREGPTYKSLPYVAHRFGMNTEERKGWYRVASRLYLSQAHVSAIISRLDERTGCWEDWKTCCGRLHSSGRFALGADAFAERRA